MDTSGSSSPEDEALKELEDFLEELFGEVGIESVDGVDINFITTRKKIEENQWDILYTKLINLRGEEEGQRLYTIFNRLRSKVLGIEVKDISDYDRVEGYKNNLINNINSLIKDYGNKLGTRSNNYITIAELLGALRIAFTQTFDYVQWGYYDNNPEELDQRQQEEISLLAEIVGVENIGRAWLDIAITVKSQIENDPELLEEIRQDNDLGDSLEGIATEDLNPFSRIKKIRKLYSLVQKSARGGAVYLGFTKVKNGDDILSAANKVKIKEKVGPGGSGILVNGGVKNADNVGESLKKTGWSSKVTKDDSTGKITTYEKGNEKINIRDFDSSSGQGKLEGYTHQRTMDIIRDGNKIGEVKFILPN